MPRKNPQPSRPHSNQKRVIQWINQNPTLANQAGVTVQMVQGANVNESDVLIAKLIKVGYSNA